MQIMVGSVAGTGVAKNVSIGFKPKYVKVVNPSDAGGLFPTMEWFEGMAAASGFKTKVVIDSGITGNKSSDYVTANGISQYAGDSSNPEGFTIGADADVNVSGEIVFYMAVG